MRVQETMVDVSLQPEGPAIEAGESLTYHVTIVNGEAQPITLRPVQATSSSDITVDPPTAWPVTTLPASQDARSAVTVRAGRNVRPAIHHVSFNVPFKDVNGVDQNVSILSELNVAARFLGLVVAAIAGGIVGWVVWDIFSRPTFAADLQAFLADPVGRMPSAVVWIAFAVAAGAAAWIVVALGRLTSGWQPFTINNRLAAFAIGAVSGVSGAALLERVIKFLMPGLLPD